MVGPMWDQFPIGCAFVLASGMLKGRLTRRVGVVRVIGSFGQGGATRRHQRVSGCLAVQAVISASTGALRLFGRGGRPAVSCPRSGPGARRRLRFQAELDGDAQVRVGGQHDTGMTELAGDRLALPASSISVAAPCLRSCSRTGRRPVPSTRSLNL